MVESSDADDSFMDSSLNVSSRRFDSLAAKLFTVEFFRADFSRTLLFGVFRADFGVDLNGVRRSTTCIDFFSPQGVLTSAAVFGDSPSARLGDDGVFDEADVLLSNRDGVLRDRSELRGVVVGVNVVLTSPEMFSAPADAFNDSFSLLKCTSGVENCSDFNEVSTLLGVGGEASTISDFDFDKYSRLKCDRSCDRVVIEIVNVCHTHLWIVIRPFTLGTFFFCTFFLSVRVSKLKRPATEKQQFHNNTKSVSYLHIFTLVLSLRIPSEFGAEQLDDVAIDNFSFAQHISAVHLHWILTRKVFEFYLQPRKKVGNN